MHGIIVVRAQRCTGCKTCELACAVEHSASQDLYEAINEEPRPAHRVDVVGIGDGAVPLQCRQCENAPCVAVCPTHALFRESPDSPVRVEQELCIGCRYCVLACPFGVIRLDSDRRAIIKCDQCFERLERGEKPACVESCPTAALIFQTQEAVINGKREAFLVKIGCAGGEE